MANRPILREAFNRMGVSHQRSLESLQPIIIITENRRELKRSISLDARRTSLLESAHHYGNADLVYIQRLREVERTIISEVETTKLLALPLVCIDALNTARKLSLSHLAQLNQLEQCVQEDPTVDSKTA